MIEKIQKKNTTKHGGESLYSDFSSRYWREEFIIHADRYFCDEKAILAIGCSWWPDSMFLTHLLLYYRSIYKKRSLSSVFLLHYNHATSDFDRSTANFIAEYFSFLPNVYIGTNAIKNPSETLLRKQRYAFFESCFTVNLQSLQLVYLCLWHNLNDRIENTYLHIDRWSHLSGIINMRMITDKVLFLNTMRYSYTLFRPLLFYTKDDITLFCRLFWLPFFSDPHNNENTKRITIRKKVQKQATIDPWLYDTMRYVYTFLEESLCVSTIYCKKIDYDFWWGIANVYKLPLATTPDECVSHLRYFSLYAGVTRETYTHLYNRIRFWSWVYVFKWWCFSKSSIHMYCVASPDKKFFEEYLNKEGDAVLVERLWVYQCSWFSRNITDTTLLWSLLRTPKPWDVYRWKKFLKRANTKKVPFFRRRRLPILEKNNTIIAVLPSSYRCR